MNLHLVNQTSLQVLLGDAGAAAQEDVFALGSFSGPVERNVNAFGEEIKCSPSLHFERLAGVMCKDKNRHVEGRLLSPPAVPWVLSLRAVATAEFVATHDFRPDVLEI